MSQGLSQVTEPRPLPIVFYDGTCGLCHHTVRYLIREDPQGDRFRFAPLGGETFVRWLDPVLRDGLPDSVVVLAPDGTVHTRSDATLALLTGLGGRHLGRARALRAIPRPLRDLAYAAVARVRHWIWARPEDACPVVSPALRTRFDP